MFYKKVITYHLPGDPHVPFIPFNRTPIPLNRTPARHPQERTASPGYKFCNVKESFYLQKYSVERAPDYETRENNTEQWRRANRKRLPHVVFRHRWARRYP